MRGTVLLTLLISGHFSVKKTKVSLEYYLLDWFILICTQMLASASDLHLGGRDIDLILAEHFSSDFQSRYRIDPRNNPRAFLRLTAEVEKLKKQMSANSTKLPMNIECFMDDKDVHGDLKRYQCAILQVLTFM